jgi:hypothetical protein
MSELITHKAMPWVAAKVTQPKPEGAFILNAQCSACGDRTEARYCCREQAIERGWRAYLHNHVACELLALDPNQRR